MVIDDLIMSPSYRLAKILTVLESSHGVKINFDSIKSLNELQGIYEAYGSMKTQLISESAFNSYYEDPQFTEAVLIQEAIHIFLSEVAPKRIKRTQKTSA